MTVAAAATGGVLTAEELERYADGVVRSCLRLGEGDVLFVQAHPEHRELAVGLADAAYRIGVRYVDVQYSDPRLQAARVRHAHDDFLGPVPEWASRRAHETIKPTSATVTILGEADPGVFDGLPPERVVQDTMRPLGRMRRYVKAVKQGRRRWTGVAWPTTAWAGQVYPELAATSAGRRLAEDLLWFCQLGPDDPPRAEGWEAHVRALAGRAARLTELRLERVELRAPGTALDVRLSPGTAWAGGNEVNAFGQTIAANMPTEEVYTSPDAAATTGTFRCTLPLAFGGRLIDGIAGELRSGRLVRLEATSDADRDFLAAFLMQERNADRLGEIALVDRESRIGQTRRTYFNTLVDENAVAHIAFGMGFAETRLPDASARGTRGINQSNLHLDVMIGSDDLEATGFAPGGRRVPLIAGGAWQI